MENGPAARKHTGPYNKKIYLLIIAREGEKWKKNIPQNTKPATRDSGKPMKRQKERKYSMSTLYEITGEYLQLLEMMEEDDGLEDQVLKDTLEGISGELEIKAENYAKIIKELTAEAVKFDAEKKRLEYRYNTINNRIKILKDHLYVSMKVTGKTKFKTDLFSFGIQKNGGKQPLEIKSEIEIPDEYCKKEADAEKIRAALEEGKTLPFAELKERGEHLRIR